MTQDNLEYSRTPFPGNRIDPSRLAPVASKALQYYPPPNASAGPFFRNNYFLVTPQTNNADGIIVNVDHTLRTRHRISVNFNYTNGLNGVGRAFEPRRVSLSPSASLAWNPLGDSKSVVRASFSRSYASGIYLNDNATQAFNAAPVYLSANPPRSPWNGSFPWRRW